MQVHGLLMVDSRKLRLVGNIDRNRQVRLIYSWPDRHISPLLFKRGTAIIGMAIYLRTTPGKRWLRHLLLASTYLSTVVDSYRRMG